MIYITHETTVEEILKELVDEECTIRDLVDLLEVIEGKADKLETGYPSNYPRPNLDSAIERQRTRVRRIRQALERYQGG